MQEPKTDVAIIGAGPIGLELAVALKRKGIDYLHFDAKQIGYTISWFAPQTRFFSSTERIAIAGVPLQTADQSKATREEYLAYLRGVVQQFDLQVQTYCPVVAIENVGDEFGITVAPASGRRCVRAKRIALCTGGTDRPRKLNVPGENLPHVSHYFNDPHVYFRKRLLVVGGKNSAVETALRCHQAGAKVALSYRQDRLDPRSIKYWLLPEINGLISEGKIAGHFKSQPVGITPSSVRLQRGDETVSVDVDFVLLQIGFEQDTTLLKLAGVELDGTCQMPTFDEQTMETNVPGVYVAGTAVGGTQDKYRVFIENCHVHIDRIMAALTGAAPPTPPPAIALPES
ncbi:MAG TPA: NAD(P)-binding domain-containing protein [Tepidisphaeraceae bacterium]|jgi:thioredoxin reductase (NADPH)